MPLFLGFVVLINKVKSITSIETIVVYRLGIPITKKHNARIMKVKSK